MRKSRALLQRDLSLMWQKRSDAIQPMLFALMVCVLFPLAHGSEPVRLAQIAPGGALGGASAGQPAGA